MKKVFVCRHCGNQHFEKKPMPRYIKTLPLKIGVVCLSCGETLVVSNSDFVDNFMIKKDK